METQMLARYLVQDIKFFQNIIKASRDILQNEKQLVFYLQKENATMLANIEYSTMTSRMDNCK